MLLLICSGPISAQPLDDATDSDLDGFPGVRMPPTPEDAYPAYSYLSGTGSLLIDRSHLENFDVSGFTNFLQSEGWVIAYQTTIPITFDALAPFDVVMIPTNPGQ